MNGWIKDRRAAQCPGCGGWIFINECFEKTSFKLDAYCDACISTMRAMIASDVRKPSD